MNVWTVTTWPTGARAALVATLQQWWDDGGEPGEDDEDGEWVILPGRVLDSLAPFVVDREAAERRGAEMERERLSRAARRAHVEDAPPRHWAHVATWIKGSATDTTEGDPR